MSKVYSVPNVSFKYERLSEPIPNPEGGADFKYRPLSIYHYHSPRYKKWCTINLEDYSDGATGAFDIESLGWWVHDMLCKRGHWNDGTKLSNWQCSTVLYDILNSEKRWCRSQYWRYLTFLRGGGEARKNGMFKVNQ